MKAQDSRVRKRIFPCDHYLLFIDQAGNQFFAKTLHELKRQCYNKQARKQYVDSKVGRPVHCGYVIGDRWLTAYDPIHVKA